VIQRIDRRRRRLLHVLRGLQARRAGLACVPACIALFAGAAPVRAQHGDHGTPRDEMVEHSSAFRVGASATGVFTSLSPAVGGESLEEGYLTLPVLMAHGALFGDALMFTATLNAEGLTLERGELTPGAWGEGYVDRRHPHTYLHELMGSVNLPVAELFRLSISGGKGFAPFGTDDPMVRPFVKYASNHHLAQILERLVVIGALRGGPWSLEAGTFNGDEPLSPSSTPRAENFADSWSARLSFAPSDLIEAQVSYAFLNSPENATGFGLDQRKWSTSLRLGQSRPSQPFPYVMVEWARTSDVAGSSPLFVFRSVLAEGAVRGWGLELAARYEDTTRPEEERTEHFRSARPATDFSIIGSTRWRTGTAALRARLPAFGFVAAEPFVEVARAHVTAGTLDAFQPVPFYGSNVLWSFSAGLRIELGASHERMGRYGVAIAPSADLEE
jgi:hypothetical protein